VEEALFVVIVVPVGILFTVGSDADTLRHAVPLRADRADRTD
jgi:hypothetical protein